MRGRKRRETERQKEGWSVIAYACGVKKKKKEEEKNEKKESCSSQACLQAGIHVKNSTKRENSQTRPETLNPCRARRYLVFNGSKPLSIAHDTFHRI